MEKQEQKPEKRARFEAGEPFEILNQKHGKLNKYRLYTHSYDGGEILWIERFSSLGKWEHHCEFEAVSDYFFMGWVLLLGDLKRMSISFDDIEFVNLPEAAQDDAQ